MIKAEKPRIAVVIISSCGILQAYDERGKNMPEYSGEDTKELRDKILAATLGNAIFYGPIGCKQMAREEFIQGEKMK